MQASVISAQAGTQRERGARALAQAGANYERWVPAFEALFDVASQDWPRFYAEVRRLAAVHPAERQRELAVFSSYAKHSYRTDTPTRLGPGP
jgi:hypothetical protein